MSAFRLIFRINWRFQIGLALSLALASSELTATGAGIEHRVQDPNYGNALYHFFQRNDLAAITRLMVARERPQTRFQRDESDLLLADLYYGYGLFQEADRLFARLLGEDTSIALKNRIWFNLARLHQEQGLYDRVEELLSRIDGRMSPGIDAERQYLLTNLYLNKQQFDLARQASQKINPGSIWSLYARYNLAVSMLESNQSDQSKPLLDSIGQMQANSSEKLALRDQANLSLGLSQLKHEQPEAALANFSRIRLQGPLSHEALLGAGWAWSRLNQPEKALVPWLELANKNTIDAATQEALLAIPTSLEQSQKKNLALQYYELAANQFDVQLGILDQVIETIRENELINVLHQQVFVSDRANFQRFPPQSSTAPFLHILFASEEFQREIKRYQDLLDIRASLLHWDSNLPVLELMLTERRNHFLQKLPLLEQSNTFDRRKKLQRSRDRLALKLSAIEADGDYLGLATVEESQHLQRAERIGLGLDRLEGRKNNESQRDMHRLLSGLLHWQISTDYAPRLWRARKELKALDLALDDAKYLIQSLNKISNNASNQFAVLERRLDGQQDRIVKFMHRVTDLVRRQEKRINNLAIHTIQLQQQHIVQLRLNTRYSLARLYDNLVDD